MQTGQYSTQIFSLAVLLSSLFVFNQMGGIDEAALDRCVLASWEVPLRGTQCCPLPGHTHALLQLRLATFGPWAAHPAHCHRMAPA